MRRQPPRSTRTDTLFPSTPRFRSCRGLRATTLHDPPVLLVRSGASKELSMSNLPAPRYLKTPDAALHVGLSPRTLEKHRCYGTGPAYRKLGGRVVYAIDDLDAWADLGRRSSTSDRSEEHTSELQSLMSTSYDVFCL